MLTTSNSLTIKPVILQSNLTTISPWDLGTVLNEKNQTHLITLLKFYY